VRFRRLALKELREILRDRRTILTLIVMPLLLYPLLSMAFQQLFLSGVVGEAKSPEFRLAFASESELRFVQALLERGKRPPDEVAAAKTTYAEFVLFVADNFDLAIRGRQVDLGIRVLNQDQINRHAERNIAVDLEVVHLEGATSALDALRVLKDRLAIAGQRELAGRLRSQGLPQREEPFRAVVKTLPDPEAKPGLSLGALVPLILILMTITGAVYPAIDLTAGERERGTLEVLVAAPLHRFSLLTAKYVAVMAVALLTALVNLVMMTLTVAVTGLGTALFGDVGLSFGLLLKVFGLLLLFAAFFSAVLLALTSFARSFKEAQAYLIPVMLLALAPGMLALMPGLKLAGPLAVAPLINIVLLARDLFEGAADPTLAIVVICSTLLYAAAALALAARVFGAEGVLYSAHTGWSEVMRRPSEPGAVAQAPTVGSALTCLAVLFPAYFFANSLLARLTDQTIALRLALSAVAGLALFLGLPLIAVWWQRLNAVSVLRIRLPHPASLVGAIALGLGLWPFAHELVILLRYLDIATLRPELLEKAKELVAEFRQVSIVVLIAALALVPAVAEEAFFRGFLFRGLEQRLRPRWTILTTAMLFGAFHLILAQAVAVERFIASACIGLILGWVAWRSGSILPTFLLHLIHNGTLVLLARYLPELSGPEWGGAEQSHVPLFWLGGAGVLVVAGTALVQWGGNRDAASSQ
jgi:ABC-2 type transport system permease protein/sodium transport system permease protein